MIYRSTLDKPLDPIINFSSRVFGKNSYQSSNQYLNWALSKDYLEISSTEDASNEVVSMIQQLTVTINQTDLKSFFNYITDGTHGGMGVRHLASIRKEKNFFIPAVSNMELGNVYKKLGATELRYKWFKRYLLPFPNIPLLYKFNRNESITTFDKSSGVLITNDISDDKVIKISKLSGITDKNFIRWRLMSKRNNRIFILESEIHKAIAIVALGKRYNIPVLRVIDSTGPSQIVKSLVDKACLLGRDLGAVICLATIHESQASDFLIDKKYNHREGIKTFEKGDIAINSLFMLCGDLGFEEQFGG